MLFIYYFSFTFRLRVWCMCMGLFLRMPDTMSRLHIGLVVTVFNPQRTDAIGRVGLLIIDTNPQRTIFSFHCPSNLISGFPGGRKDD
jgi:hypothetical protein